jgi:hypothetical protein
MAEDGATSDEPLLDNAAHSKRLSALERQLRDCGKHMPTGTKETQKNEPNWNYEWKEKRMKSDDSQKNSNNYPKKKQHDFRTRFDTKAHHVKTTL